jgi:hypothetical protein
VTSATREQIELRQSVTNMLSLPILIAVVLLAVVIRQLFASSPSAIVIGVCAGVAVLDISLGAYFVRSMGATLVVTVDSITYTPRRRAAQQVIQRADDSTLSFRMAGNGPTGSEFTGYVLKLRDNATGQEFFAGPFGRTKVQKACESQGWSFS